MNKPKKIILIPNTEKNINKCATDSLIKRLTDGGCTVAVFDDCGLDDDRHVVIRSTDDIKDADVALVLGGDGSIIDAGHRLLGRGIAILGINFGHVGFLTELEEEEMPLVDRLLRGDYKTDERMMLSAEVRGDDGKIKAEYTVLNDIVITNGPVARMISFELFSSGEKIGTFRADGFIAATPTGSTAYSLSAGGPVLDPSLDVIGVTPICPHTLTSRPIIFSGDSVISAKILSENSSTVYLNADGREVCRIDGGDTVTVRRSPYTTKLIRIKDTGFVNILRSKLSDNRY